MVGQQLQGGIWHNDLCRAFGNIVEASKGAIHVFPIPVAMVVGNTSMEHQEM